MSEQQTMDRLSMLHGYLGDALLGDEMVQAFELASEIAQLAKQAYDDERAAFISTHHGDDR